jgi:hypothetical protein
MWKNALPANFRHPASDIGSVYAATMSDEPPLRVREVQFGDDENKRRIVIELENIMGQATKEILGQFALDERDVEPDLMRVAINVSCARKLSYFLLHTLAEEGDPVCVRLKDALDEALADMRREKEEEDDEEQEV